MSGWRAAAGRPSPTREEFEAQLRDIDEKFGISAQREWTLPEKEPEKPERTRNLTDAEMARWTAHFLTSNLSTSKGAKPYMATINATAATAMRARAKTATATSDATPF